MLLIMVSMSMIGWIGNPKITLPEWATHHAAKSTNRVIHPWVSILLQCRTGNPHHQITTKHTLHPLSSSSRSLYLPHRHLPFSPNRSSSTLLTRLARHIVSPT